VQYLFDKSVLMRTFEAGRKIALFLDFDGTLVPIQNDPTQCFLSNKLKKQLLLLAGSKCCYLVVLTGRSLSDIKKRIGIRTIYYGGNHGLDISGPDLRYTHPGTELSKPALKCLIRRLKQKVADIEGVWIENKKFTVSLHFRSVKKEDISLVKKVFHAVADEFVAKKLLRVIKGKKVLELVPDISWNKGYAARWILQQMNYEWLPIYIGDDQTDETAFEVFKKKGITIRIGESKKTAANFYLKSQREVPRLLSDIQEYTREAA
jgi:trehalose 6-phosphate phosphatase